METIITAALILLVGLPALGAIWFGLLLWKQARAARELRRGAMSGGPR